MKKRGIAFGIILSISATAANAAEVDSSTGDNDQKRYSAAGCGATNHGKAQVTKAGSVFNTATGTNTITCPVVLDRPTSDNDTYQLRVFRAAGAGTMTCYLVTQSGSTTTTINQNVLTTGVDATLFFVGSGGLPSSAVVGCSVPGKVAGGSSGIKYYAVTEY
jgi:hypothetical protein